MPTLIPVRAAANVELIRDRRIYAGLWCLDVWDSKQVQGCWEVLPYSWRDRTRVLAASSLCEELYASQMLKISQCIIRAGVASHKGVDIQLVFGPWLRQFIEVVFDRYAVLAAARASIGSLTVLASEDAVHPITVPADCKYSEDKFNHGLYTTLARTMGIELLFFNGAQEEHFAEPKTYTKKKNISGWLVYSFTNFINKILRPNRRYLVFSPYLGEGSFLKLLRLVFASRGSFVFSSFFKSISFESKRNKQLRSEIFTVSADDDELCRCLGEALQVYFPTIYLESFAVFKDYAQSHILGRVDAVYSATGIWNVPELTIALAAIRATNQISRPTFVYAQHGGNYGIDAVSMGEAVERRLADVFFSWGWQGEGVVPVSKPPVSVRGCILKSWNSKTQILLVLTAPHRYEVMFSTLAHSTLAADNFRSTLDLAVSLTAKYKVKIRAHPGMYTSGWGEHLALENRVSNFEWSSETQFSNAAANSQLVVYNHMHTAYRETLEANIPTLIIIDKTHYRFRESEKYLIDSLLASKILFWSVDEAVEHIDSVIENIESWWLSPKVQFVRREFLKKHFLTSSHWASNLVSEVDAAYERSNV